MRETKVYCDHCGKELNEMKDYCDTEVGILDFIDTDLCINCINELQNLVKKFVKKE